MTIYYIDAVNGSNTNSGTSEGSALQSLAAVSDLKLKAGDSVLLARGSVFTDTLTLTKSGAVDNPITIGAYGDGSNPVLSGTMGIHGSKASNIVIHDLTIADTKATAIYAGNSSNWVIDNVSLSNTGTSSGIGSIVFKNSSDITVSNSNFDHVQSDGIYVVGITNFKAINNTITNLTGHTADGIQVNDSNNIILTGNKVDQTTSLDSTKGGIMVNNVTNVVVTDNVVAGGSFGIAANGWNIVIDDNQFSGQNKYTWSASILIGGSMDLSDYIITNNEIVGSRYGVALTGLRADDVTRTNIDISGNSFTDIEKTALKIDMTSTGSFHDNVIVNSEVSMLRWEGQDELFTVVDNIVLTTEEAAALFAPPATNPPVGDSQDSLPAHDSPPVESAPPIENAGEPATPVIPTPAAPTPSAPVTFAPGANIDRFSMDTAGHQVTGNILTNDLNAEGDTLLLRTVGSSRIGAGGVDVNGLYGTLHVDIDGSFVYTLFDNALNTLHGATSLIEKFQYKAADGKVIDTSKLMIDLSDYVEAHDHILM